MAGAAATTLALAEVRALLAERLAGPPDARELPHRPPDDLHARADALGAAPRRLPARARRRRVPAQVGARRRRPRARDPHVGDRDARTEDRQLLLDALMAATDRLIVTYTGNDERTNTPRPPAVPVGELLDVVDAHRARRRRRRARATGCSSSTRCSRSTRATSRPASSCPARHWSFDRVTLAGRPRARRAAHRAAAVPRRPAARRSSRRWSSSTTSCASPSTRSGRSCASGSGSCSATSTTRSTTRCRSSSTTSSSGASARGCSRRGWPARTMDACVAAEVARGLLPPGRLGEPVIERLRPTVEELARLRAAARRGRAALGRRQASRSATAASSAARCPGVHGDLLRVVQYSRVGAQAPARRVGAAARAHRRPPRPADPGRADGPGARRARRAPVTICRLPAVGADAAREQLAVLLDLYDRGMREPLPLACARLGRLRARSGEAARRARRGSRTGTSPRRTPSPSTSSRSAACCSFDELLALAAARRARTSSRTSRRASAGSARRLWDGLLAVRGAGGGMSTRRSTSAARCRPA